MCDQIFKVYGDPTQDPEEYTELLETEAEEYFEEPYAEAVSVSIRFVIPKEKGNPGEAHFQPPPIDRMLCTVLDALRGYAYGDKQQITLLGKVEKELASRGNGPRVEVRFHIKDAIREKEDKKKIVPYRMKL